MNLYLKDIFLYLFPLLLITWLVFKIARFVGLFRMKAEIIKPVMILISVAATLYPFTGLSLAGYLLSLNPNFSIGSTALVFVFLWKALGGKQLLSDRDILWFSVFNVVVALCLYSSYMGFVRFDLYNQGYGFSAWFVIMILLTVILFIVRNPLSYIFIAYIIAFNLRLLNSDNLYDYVTDGILFLISVGLIVSSIMKIVARGLLGSRSSHS